MRLALRVWLGTAILLFAACGNSTETGPINQCPADRTCGSTCCEVGQTCDSTTLTCTSGCTPNCGGRECGGDDGCGHSCGSCAAGKYCDALGTCQTGCIADGDCSQTPSAPLCDVAAHACVACLFDTDCMAPAKRCEPTLKDCVACLGGTDCELGSYCTESHTCVPGCGTNADCAALSATPVCDVARNLCVTCLDDTHCAGATPKCETSSKSCVECLAKADCGAGSVCEVATHRCKAGCADDTDCAGVAGKPICDVPNENCVQCLGDANCGAGANPKCDPSNQVCVGCLASSDCGSEHYCDSAKACQSGCAVSSDCTGVTGRPVCDAPSHACVACLDDSECSIPTPKCDTTIKSCVGCLSTSECGSGYWCDPSTKSCAVGCGTNADCIGVAGSPVCNVTSHVCVGCLGHGDCATTPATPKCDGATSACVACLSTADCAAGNYCDATSKNCKPGCDADSGCSGNPTEKKCDVAHHACVVCLDDSNCNGTTPKCDIAGGNVCVGCLNDGNCGGTTPTCDTAAGKVCVGCVNDANCGGTTPKCNTAAGKVCVGCLDTLDCVAGKYCNLVSQSCLAGCDADSQCTAEASKRKCDVPNHACVGCIDDTTCVSPTGKCDVVGGHVCVSCLDDGNCSGATPKCDIAGGLVCVGCLNDGNCSAGTPKCNATKTCVECILNADCVAPKKLCTAAHACIECESGADCTSGMCGPSNACVSAETCSPAAPLTLAADGTAAVSGTLVGASGDSQGSCGGSTSPDLVYSFTLTSGSNVTATITTTTPGFRPMIYLRRVCASSAAADEVGCTAAAAGANSTALTTLLSAGTYYVVVDGFLGTSGAFQLSLATTALAPGKNCFAAVALTGLDAVTGLGIANATGTTNGRTQNTDGTCASGSGYDLAYYIDLPVGSLKDIAATMTFTGGTGTSATSPRASVYIRKACTTSLSDSANEIACTKATTALSATVATARRVPPGRYFIFADSASSTQYGPFTLQVEVTNSAAPPANDVCGGAIDMGIANGVTLTQVGDTTNASDDYSGGCSAVASPLNGGDLVYKFSLNAAQKVTAKATISGSTYKTAVYIRAACPNTVADELACGMVSFAYPGAYAFAVASSLPAGTYYVVVDGVSKMAGAFTLTVTGEPPDAAGPNDCSSYKILSGFDAQGNGTVTETGDSSWALDHGTGTCKADSTLPDAVYAFDVPAGMTKDVTVKETISSAGVGPLVYIRRVCASGASADEVACGFAAGNTPVTVKAYRLTAGRYFVFADAATTNYDPQTYTLAVTLSNATPPPTPPSNDKCAGATDLGTIDLTTVTPVTGDTTQATNDYSASCGTSTGPDLVYKFALATPQSVTAKVTAGAATPAFVPVAYLRQGCPGLATEDIACAAGVGIPAEASVGGAYLLPGTYYLIVGGSSGSKGSFTLTATAAQPHPEHCALAKAITGFDAQGNGTVTVQGDTTFATHDSNGTCTTGVLAKDVVYYVDLPAGSTKNLTAKMTFTASNVSPAVYIRKTNCSSTQSSDEVACIAAPTGNIVTARARSLAAGRYFIFADGAFASAAGPFSLAVTVNDLPPAPANDTCGGVTAGSTYDLTAALAAGSGHITVATDTTIATGSDSGLCATMNGNEVVYRFDLSAASTVLVTVSPDVDSVDLQPAAYLRSTCASAAPGDQVACSSAAFGPIQLTKTTLGAGTYYLFVDSLAGTMGRAIVDLRVMAPLTAPTNDTCTAIQDLGDITTGPKSASGFTYAADATTSPTSSCASGTSGPDVVYSFNSGATPQPVSVKLTATTADLSPLVYVRSACSDATSTAQVKCGYSASALGYVNLNLVGLTANTPYYVWVDGFAGSMGGYRLDLTPLTAPSNDTCGAGDAHAIALTLNTVVNGDTSLAMSNYGGFIGGQCNKTYSGPDVVYKFTPTTSADFTVTATPAFNYSVALWISNGSCGSTTSCLRAVNPGILGQKASLTVANPTAGTTYYVYVTGPDATPTGMGSFSILVY